MNHKIRLKFCLDKHQGEHYSHFDMCRLERLWKTRIRTAALPCLQSIASGNSKTWDFDIFLKHDVPVFYNRKRCLDAHFFRRSWPFLTKFQMIISKVFRIKVGKNSLIWWRILGTSLVAVVIECRRGGAIYLFTYRMKYMQLPNIIQGGKTIDAWSPTRINHPKPIPHKNKRGKPISPGPYQQY